MKMGKIYSRLESETERREFFKRKNAATQKLAERGNVMQRMFRTPLVKTKSKR